MKQTIIILLIALILGSCGQVKNQKCCEKQAIDISFDSTQKRTNDFYDDAETFVLEGTRKIKIEGEISNPGEIDIENLPLRSLIVKEAIISGNSNKFVGAYRYDGYSLYDILNEYKLEKKNADSFKPIIDLYVIVENDAGEKVVLSWGELYYPVNQHDIIIATRVTRIVPSKTKDLWPLPGETRLIVSHDLLTERNISNPTKITIVSDEIELVVKKGMKPLFSPDITVYNDNEELYTFNSIPEGFIKMEYESVFYGRGRGIHSTSPFHGYMLKEIIKKDASLSKQNIQNGIIVLTSTDGYRGVFSFSEIFNRNDQSEILLIPDPSNTEDGGAFRIFPSCDFFSDRAIKAVNGIYLNHSSVIRNP